MSLKTGKFFKMKNFTLKRRPKQQQTEPVKIIIGELYENPKIEYDKTNPMYSNIDENDFKSLKENVIKVKDIVTEFKKETEKTKEKLEKVDISITRGDSTSIFDPFTEPEPSIDDILNSDGKAYLIWMESQRRQKSGGRKSLAKKSRRRRRKTRRSIRK